MRTWSLLLIALIFSVERTSAQTVHPLPDSGAVWSVGHLFMGDMPSNSRFGMMGDTLIDGLSYKKIGQTPDTIFTVGRAVYCGGLREADGKWYMMSVLGEELMLYDFRAEPGDVMPAEGSWSIHDPVTIASVDSVELAGSYHRRLRLVEDPYVQWIDGIGSTYGPFTPLSFMTDIGDILLCYKLNDDVIYLDPDIGLCEYIHIGIEEHAAPPILIAPNPVIDVATISCPTMRGPLTLEVCDATGRLVKQAHSIDGVFNVRRSELGSGLFICRMHDQGGVVSVARLVLQ